MGALALATEDPNPELLSEMPHGRNEALITRRMWKHILVQGIYQLFWMMFSLYALPLLFDYYYIRSPSEYYSQACLSQLQPPAYTNGTAQLYCNWMNQCGLPYGNPNTGEATVGKGKGLRIHAAGIFSPLCPSMPDSIFPSCRFPCMQLPASSTPASGKPMEVKSLTTPSRRCACRQMPLPRPVTSTPPSSQPKTQ